MEKLKPKQLVKKSIKMRWGVRKLKGKNEREV